MNPTTWTLRQQIERGIAAAALLLVIIWPAAGCSSYWSHTILLETFIFGIAAASLIFLSAYGGMVSLAQTALFGTAGIIFGNMATKGGPGGTSKGLHLGWDPTVALILALVLTTVIGLIGGAVASRSAGIYFLMITLTYSVIATYTLSQVTNISGFSGIGGINRYTPGWIGNLLDHPNRLYYIALGVAIFAYVVIRYLVRTPFGLSLQGVRDEPIRAASLGYNVPLHRTLAFGFAAFLAGLAGVLYAWFAGQVAPGDVDLPQTINLLIMAVIGGLVRIEGAWVGAFVFFVMQNYITTTTHIPLLGFGGTLFGGSFNTIIGIIFLAIVVVSPDGLLGLWDRLFTKRRTVAEENAGIRRRSSRRHDVSHRRTRLASWVATARESLTPSRAEEGGGHHQMRRLTLRSWKTAAVLRRDRRRRCNDDPGNRRVCVVSRQGRQGRDHDGLQGRLRVRLRRRHRRRADCLRAVRPRCHEEPCEAVRRDDGHPCRGHADQDRRLRLRQRHRSGGRDRDEAADGEAERRRHGRPAVG